MLKGPLTLLACVVAAFVVGCAHRGAPPPVDATFTSSPAARHRIAVGEGHACVIGHDESVTCWGRDSVFAEGQAPAAVPGLPRARALFASGAATCASTEAGIACWGDNTFGQLVMPPNMVYRKAPEHGHDGDWIEARDGALGPDGACAIRGEVVYCWGAVDKSTVPYGGSRFGIIADNERARNEVGGQDTTKARQVPGVDGAVQVSFGTSHLCALMRDRTVRCLGSNRLGQLGRREPISQEYYAAGTVEGLSDVVQIEAGVIATCARTVSGEVHCWGSDFFGQLGVRDYPRLAPAPVMGHEDPHDRISRRPERVLGLPPARQLSVGGTHVCAVGEDAHVYCWGMNSAGQLGDGTTARADTPRRMKGVARAVDVGAKSGVVILTHHAARKIAAIPVIRRQR